MFWALQELVGPGDHALVTVPNYQSIETLPLRTGAHVERVRAAPRRRLGARPRRLVALLRPNTTLVAVNFPNNPTGAVADRATFRARRAVRRARHPAVQRRGLPRPRARPVAHAAPGRRPVRARPLAQRHVQVLRAPRRCGSAGSPRRDRALLERLERRKHYTSICNAGPSELLATIALHNGERILARNRAIIAANLPRLRRVLRPLARALRVGAPAGRLRLLPALAHRRRRAASAAGSSRPPACSCSRPTSTPPSSPRSPPTVSASAWAATTPAQRWPRSTRSWPAARSASATS